MLFTLLAESLRSFLDKPGSFLDKSDLSRKDQNGSASRLLVILLKKDLSLYFCFKVNKKLINLEDNRRSNSCVQWNSGWGCTRISLQY